MIRSSSTDHPSSPRLRRAWRPMARALAVGGMTLGLFAAPGAVSTADGAERVETADDLMIVDCLLPQKVRRLGRSASYLQPRRPIRTTAVDCRIRGGEYTQPDQANYQTSLRVWLPQAEAGEAEAQYFVGQIYERGLGTEPDYARAAAWYGKAAEQDYTPAMTNLGYLHEEGLGVEEDSVVALNWYRRAAGLSEDLVVLEEGEYDDLVAQLAAREQDVEALQREIAELRRQMAETAAESDAERQRRTTLASIVDRLEADLAERQRELDSGRQRIAALEQRIETVAARGPTPSGATTRSATLADIRFGDFHALVIGNSAYSSLPPIASAAQDARLVADLLRERYGFEVRLLLDADRFEIMSALNDLREELDSEDNLLVYYAGHGERDATGQTAYWQPVDADPRSPVNWIPNGLITEHLDLIPAKHVFVVADSVYSGLRTRSSIARLPRGMTPAERFYHIKLLTEKRARLVLSSGGPGAVGSKEPRTSSFASTFVDVLAESAESDVGVLEASTLYRKINDRLAESQRGTTDLEFATMKWARNDLADFFFVPAR
ncbi:MAG: caspase family protein [Acidobacteriota bacterium]